MFEQYTESARRVIFFARYEASALSSASIDTEHLLLGLVREGRGVAGEILKRGGLTHGAVQRQLEDAKDPAAPTPTSVDIPLAPHALKALRGAAEEAERMDAPHIGVEHLLLGLLAVPDSVAGRILAAHGLRLDEVREEVRLRAPAKRAQSDHGIPSNDWPTFCNGSSSTGRPTACHSFSERAIRVDIALPDEKWVVTFFDDRRIAVEVFLRSGVVEDAVALERLFDKLGTEKSG